ncbi:MAG TPA: hypothetical protein VKJ45_13550 [Blastocatellia bacterium]|nr:hypothetical protein [Blastocatellia bacterium]
MFGCPENLTLVSEMATIQPANVRTFQPARVQSRAWLFSRDVDLLVFLGSPVVALLLIPLGMRAGVLYGDTPDWTWVPAVLLVDVAHVYATAFRVYLDREELARRKTLYGLVPLIGFAFGILLYSRGEIVFWRALAYLAVFHFIRQQYGWLALYRAKAGERGRLGKLIDSGAIYLATIYPVVYWHTHLPRHFWWFLQHDFAAMPVALDRVLLPVYLLALVSYAARSIYRSLVLHQPNPGKDIVVFTTAVCWYVGIVGLNSDYVFTVTNVITHGVPYLALVYWYARSRRDKIGGIYRTLARSPLIFLLVLWLAAYLEELLWDRGVWHDRAWLFGAAWDTGWFKVILVPLLALPQLVHYVLDGFVWRRKNNPSWSL